MAKVLTFCSRCGESQDEGDLQHYQGGSCSSARPVHQRELIGPEGVACPVAGCRFRLPNNGQSVLGARTKFDLHLAWHSSSGAVAQPVAGAPGSAFARLEQTALELGCTAEDIAATRRVLSRVLELP